MAARAIAAALTSGVLMWLAAPAVGLGWLAWVALVPAAAVALSHGGRLGRLSVPLAYGLYMELLLVPALPFGLTDGQWGDPAAPLIVDGSPVLAVALLGVPALTGLLYLLRFGQPPLQLSSGATAALAVIGPAIVWVALDFARAKLDPGGLWGPLFLDQADGPGGELAAFGGPWLVTLAIVAANYGIALALVRRRRLAALIPAGAVAAGLVAAPLSGASGGEEEKLVVAAVQPGYDTAEEDRAELRHFEPGSYHLAAADLIRDLAPLTREAAGRGAELVVWPEAAIWVDPLRNRAVRRRLAKLGRTAGLAIVVPYFLPEPDRGAAVAVIGDRPGAAFAGPRPKQRPMWFLGESADSAPAEPIEAGGLAVGTLLGVDTQDPHVAALLAGRGARVLTSSTHDWRQLAVAHRASAAIAARSAGLPLVRADWRYGSAIYSPAGQVVADAGSGLRRTVVVAAVERFADPAAYASLGDALGWVACAGALIMLVLTATAARPAPIR